MVLGLFGRSRKQERELRTSVSLSKFEVEFPKMLAHFEIKAPTRSTKSARFNEIDAACNFMLANAVRLAKQSGQLSSSDDLTAVTTFSAAMCEFMGANGGLEMADVTELQGSVPVHAIPKAAGGLLSSGADFSKSVSGGILRYGALLKKGKSGDVFAKIDDALEQFLVQRNVDYLSILGAVKDDLK